MTIASSAVDRNPGRFAGLEPSTLLINHSISATRSLHEARTSVENVFCRHVLRTSRPIEKLDFVHRSAKLSSISLNLIRYGADVEVTVNDPDRDQYILVAPLSGNAQVKQNDKLGSLERGHFILLDPRARFHFDMLANHSHLAIGIPTARLRRYVSRRASKHASNLEFSRKPCPITENTQSFFDFVAYVCADIDSSFGLASRPFVSRTIEESLLSLFASAFLEIDKDGGQVLNEVVAPQYLLLAEQYILENLTEDISAEDIQGIAGVPMRTLYHAFHVYRGVSPMRWLKLQRLRRARTDLLEAPSSGTSVTEIANRYQLSHVGRFARAYCREFGEMPSYTIRAHRTDDF